MYMPNGRVFTDRLDSYGSAPGYREVSLVVEINRGNEKEKVELKLTHEDALSIMRHIIRVNREAWTGGAPIDVKEGESRPVWLSAFDVDSKEIRMIEEYRGGKSLPGCSTSETICLALAVGDYALIADSYPDPGDAWLRLNERQQKIVQQYNDKYRGMKIGSLYR